MMSKHYWATLNAMEYLEDLEKTILVDYMAPRQQHEFYLTLVMLQEAIKDPDGVFEKPMPMVGE
jgi:hypothetical protein